MRRTEFTSGFVLNSRTFFIINDFTNIVFIKTIATGINPGSVYKNNNTRFGILQYFFVNVF